jgi:hypothetical protein
LEPVHIQFHGPEPLTAVALPVLQRFAVGAALTAVPFAVPQAPFTGVPPPEPPPPPELLESVAWHEAVAPPLVPAHIQFHGPEPLIAVELPLAHRFAVGAVLIAAPFAEPQVPATACGDEGGAADCEPQAARKSRMEATQSCEGTRIKYITDSISPASFSST